MKKANLKNKMVSPNKFISENPNSPRNNAFIYCRVDEDKVASREASLNGQRQTCEDYCKRHNLNVVKVSVLWKLEETKKMYV